LIKEFILFTLNVNILGGDVKLLNFVHSNLTKDNLSKVKNQRAFIEIILFLILVYIIPLYSQNPNQSIMDINNITLWVRNDGFHDWVTNDSYCSTFPKGTTGPLFTEGIVWGGKVFDGNDTIVRVNGCTYKYGNYSIERLYRVRSDYLNTDLTDDAANFFLVPENQVNESMISAVYNQYEKDWKEWPAEKGAPYLDVNKNGKYEPDIDIPGVPGASQTIWINYNDGNSYNTYGSPQIGLDIRETYWASESTSSLGNIIYKKVDIIYNGTQNKLPDSRIDGMYICQFVDTDIGVASDDFLGCDTLLNLGYAYNSSNYDDRYEEFHLAPPAVGHSVLNGPALRTGNSLDSAIINLKWRHGYKYFNPKPLTVFVAHRTGGNWADASFNYTGTLEFYNLMRGYRPQPPYPASEKLKGEFNGYGTYMLSGDPITKEGWVDGVKDSPGDRRFWSMSGPLNMKLGDTAEVVYAIVGGLGDNNLSSITHLKLNTKWAISDYYKLVDELTNNRINIPEDKIPPDHYTLYQNYPNPFNSTTVIKYEIPDNAYVNLVIYDVLGRAVKTLIDEEKEKGIYKVNFYADNLPSGIYFCRISFDNSKSKLIFDGLTKVNKLILIK
jgi:Secretion system C-terminal sorting domain